MLWNIFTSRFGFKIDERKAESKKIKFTKVVHYIPVIFYPKVTRFDLRFYVFIIVIH